MKASIRELRNSMKRILCAVQRGEEVMIYSHQHPVAKLVPIRKTETAEVELDYGFGMWGDDVKTKDVLGYLKKLRKGRQHDF